MDNKRAHNKIIKTKLISILVLCLITTGCGSRLFAGEEYSLSFDDPENLPARIIFNESYFEETKNIFFVQNSYTKNYSKLVKYNVEEEKIVSVIKETGNQDIYIKEFDNDNDYIVFSVLNGVGKLSQEIYYYNIRTEELKQITDCSLSDYPRLFPIRLNISGHKIVWVEHDFENNKSNLKLFDIDTQKTETVDSADFTSSRFKVSIIFAEFKEGLIFYDKDSENAPPKIYCYDTSEGKIIDQFNSIDGVVIHFGGAYNSEENFLALYVRTENDEQVCKIDLDSKEITSLVGMRDHTVLYEDLLESEKNKIYYTVQINVTGNAKDHYFSEIYDLDDYTIDRIERAFHIVKSENYLATLQFDKKAGVQTIWFKLRKKR